MKKIFSIMAAAAIALTANAQVLKSNFFNGYNKGDKLEKSVYESKDAAELDSWHGIFATKPQVAPCFSVGEALSYSGYKEGGLSAQFGDFEQGQKGARFSVYTLTDGKQYGKGTFYLSFLINMKKVSGSGMADLVGLSPNAVGGGNRANICVAKESSGTMRFGIKFLKLSAECAEAFDLNETHLCVLKYDFKNQKVSLYVDPDLSAGEPAEAVVSIDADEDNVLKHAIRGITLRNRAGFQGNIGNFRWSNSWDGVIAD